VREASVKITITAKIRRQQIDVWDHGATCANEPLQASRAVRHDGSAYGKPHRRVRYCCHTI
jgi:hypothetical protein